MLTANATLTSVAREHSTDMGQHAYFAHDTQAGVSFSQRITNAGYRWGNVAENIAAGPQTAQSVMNMWMNSSGHRANILNCGLTQIGVGYASVPGSPYGSYWTQDFATPA